jgi:hypothetical protein
LAKSGCFGGIYTVTNGNDSIKIVKFCFFGLRFISNRSMLSGYFQNGNNHCSCSIQIPEDAILQKTAISISPDYSDLTIPWNIAPLNFTMNETGDDYLTVLHSSKGDRLVARGKKVMFNLKEWENLLEANKGDTLYKENILVYSVNSAGQHFHTKNTEKVEVMDTQSDLILYDVAKNEVRIVENDSSQGRKLSFAVVHRALDYFQFAPGRRFVHPPVYCLFQRRKSVQAVYPSVKRSGFLRRIL